jgi:hypothetical protein
VENDLAHLMTPSGCDYGDALPAACAALWNDSIRTFSDNSACHIPVAGFLTEGRKLREGFSKHFLRHFLALGIKNIQI